MSSRLEDLPAKDDSENRTNKFRRKDWSLSRSQVIAGKEPEADLTPKLVINELQLLIPMGDLYLFLFPRQANYMVVKNREGLE